MHIGKKRFDYVLKDNKICYEVMNFKALYLNPITS